MSLFAGSFCMYKNFKIFFHIFVLQLINRIDSLRHQICSCLLVLMNRGNFVFIMQGQLDCMQLGSRMYYFHLSSLLLLWQCYNALLALMCLDGELSIQRMTMCGKLTTRRYLIIASVRLCVVLDGANTCRYLCLSYLSEFE